MGLLNISYAIGAVFLEIPDFQCLHNTRPDSCLKQLLQALFIDHRHI